MGGRAPSDDLWQHISLMHCILGPWYSNIMFLVMQYIYKVCHPTNRPFTYCPANSSRKLQTTSKRDTDLYICSLLFVQINIRNVSLAWKNMMQGFINQLEPKKLIWAQWLCWAGFLRSLLELQPVVEKVFTSFVSLPPRKGLFPFFPILLYFSIIFLYGFYSVVFFTAAPFPVQLHHWTQHLVCGCFIKASQQSRLPLCLS